MTKPIRIENANEFDALMEGLASDVSYAEIHFGCIGI